MSSEVEGAADSTAGGLDESTPAMGGPLRPSLVGRAVRRALRPLLLRQAQLERALAEDRREHAAALEHLEYEMRLAAGTQAGRLRGELSDLRLTLHQLAAHLPAGDHRVEPVGPGVPTAGGPPPPGTGVNLVADLTATTGLAEAGRRLAVGLHRRGVAMAVTPFRSGAPQLPGLCPPELRDLPEGGLQPVDLVTLNINEVPAVPLDRLGRAHSGRPAAATWYWEFETLSPELVGQLDRVDEIWAPTRFVQAALARYTATPIHIVPTIVPRFEASEPRHRLRRQWGVGDRDVVFLFTFDFNSSILRKNPLGAVDAYRRAFGEDGAGTRLVIKAINLANSPAFESELRAAVSAVHGVVIDEHLSEAELANVFHATDVYVSLHRSEGFGLGMAEAMALGKAVIGTAYSGNVDFMDGSNSALVGYHLRPVVPDDHRYSGAVGTVYRPGFLCAEPDLDQAARWMRALVADPELRGRMGAAAEATMAERFSEEAVIDTAVPRLLALGSGPTTA